MRRVGQWDAEFCHSVGYTLEIKGGRGSKGKREDKRKKGVKEGKKYKKTREKEG